MKILVLFNFGLGFGGFRFALNSEKYGFDCLEIFNNLELAVNNVMSLFELYPYSEWGKISHDTIKNKIEGNLNDNYIEIDAMEFEQEEEKHFVMRLYSSFKWFPIGGYAYYDGFVIDESNSVMKINKKLLANYW